MSGSISTGRTTYFDAFGIAVACFIIDAVFCLTANIQMLVRNGTSLAVFRGSIFSLFKTGAGSLFLSTSGFAADINVRTAAAVVTVICAVTYGTL